MKIEGVSQLKGILSEVVIVVLIVIFARIVVGTVDSGKSFEWSMLVLPASILMIALALRMIELAGGKGGPNAGRAEEGMMTQPGSAYSLDKREEKPETHTMTVLVDNEPGVLARVIGLFSGRGYNIDSLTVSETEHEAHLSRITIVTSGPPMVIEQIQHQLERLVPIHSVTDLTVLGNPLERELAMVKVAGQGREARRGAAAGREPSEAQIIDSSTGHFVFEITGEQSKIEQFIARCSRSAWSRSPAPGLPPSRAAPSACNAT